MAFMQRELRALNVFLMEKRTEISFLLWLAFQIVNEPE